MGPGAFGNSLAMMVSRSSALPAPRRDQSLFAEAEAAGWDTVDINGKHRLSKSTRPSIILTAGYGIEATRTTDALRGRNPRSKPAGQPVRDRFRRIRPAAASFP
jgi:hypothetical protein